MSLRIRLSRNKKKNDPCFRIIVADSRKKRDGAFIEKVGFYNPTKKDLPKFELTLERVNYWISVGAQPSERVAKFIEIKKTGKHFEKPQKIEVTTVKAEEGKTYVTDSDEDKIEVTTDKAEEGKTDITDSEEENFEVNNG